VGVVGVGVRIAPFRYDFGRWFPTYNKQKATILLLWPLLLCYRQAVLANLALVLVYAARLIKLVFIKPQIVLRETSG
jgi:hypothetical protein